MKKVSTTEATKILKEIVKKAHIESKHSGTGSRLKSIFGLQKTSIGMFLDSILSQYEKYASKAHPRDDPASPEAGCIHISSK